NIWATWCAPCMLELPYLQKVHEALGERSGAQVVTLNIDRNPGLVAPFLERHGYTFPVCLATDNVGEIGGASSVPQTWIVDRDGIIRHSQNGFDPTGGDRWTAEVLAMVASLADR
ncbi:MAG TPA: TlpA disulfide reductase family protein, partial [Candidatus Sulfomarinibacteraceae bacterium]|nr:TlpA disulfide reductase family protein [Candidatus Sulfomarinibacteraceae bacterium]